MKRVILLYIFLFTGIGTFAQKNNDSDNTQDKNKKSDQETRYTEGASGVKRSIAYKFSNLITDEDPGNGTFRYNKDTVSKSTYIFADIIDISGEDQTKWYSTWENSTGATGRGQLNLVEYEGKNVNVFNVTGVFIEERGYWKIPVEYVSGSLPANGVTYYYIFERIENKDKTAKEEKHEQECKVEEVAVAAAKPQTTQPSQPKTTTQSNPPPQPAPTTQGPSGGNVNTGNSAKKPSDGSRRWHGIIETGYGFKIGDYALNNYRINFIGSYSIGQHFMIGLGLGYRNYFDKPDKHPDWYMVSGKNQVPIFIDLRVLLSKKQLTPFLALGLGSSTEKSKSDNTSSGSFINPSAGIWYRLSKNTALFADVAYEMMEMEYANHADNIPYRRKKQLCQSEYRD